MTIILKRLCPSLEFYLYTAPLKYPTTCDFSPTGTSPEVAYFKTLLLVNPNCLQASIITAIGPYPQASILRCSHFPAASDNRTLQNTPATLDQAYKPYHMNDSGINPKTPLLKPFYLAIRWPGRSLNFQHSSRIGRQ